MEHKGLVHLLIATRGWHWAGSNTGAQMSVLLQSLGQRLNARVRGLSC